MDDFGTVKVAGVQMAPVYMDRDATVDKICEKITEASETGAKVIAFPEAIVPGYPYWIFLGNFDYHLKYYRKLYRQAVEIPSESVRKISAASRKAKAYVCVSVTEKSGASLYLTQLWFSPTGDLIGKHRKFKATNVEKTIWGDGDGSMAPVFETEYGNLGGYMCWEHILPLNLALMASQNEQIHVAAWPNGLEGEEGLYTNRASTIITQYYALSNQCFCIMCTNIYTEEIRDVVGYDDYSRNLNKPGFGATKIIAPNGCVIAEAPSPDEEAIVVADCDLSMIIDGKFCTDPAGHYSTPGFLSLIFDQTEHLPVKKIGMQADHSISFEELQEM